ncbi:MAG: sugar MFS transporter [Bacteroidota bacterium]
MSNNQTKQIAIIGGLFFIFGFISWLNSILIPYLKIACELRDWEAYLVTFAFYISYTLLAIPSSWILKRTGFNGGMQWGLYIMAIGSLMFIPAAYTRTYGIFLLGLFIQGAGLTLLQTASNPYITILGPIESASKRISIMGICNKVAGVIAPLVLGAVVLKNTDGITEHLKSLDLVEKEAMLNVLALRVVTPYLIITAVLAGLGFMIKYSNLPDIKEPEDEAGSAGKQSVFQYPHLVLGFVAIFCSVSLEVITGDTIVNYAVSQGLILSKATFFPSIVLFLMGLGYIIGVIVIPRYIRQERLFFYASVAGTIVLTGVLATNGLTSLILFATLGLFHAILWPAIWPLALKGLGKHTKIGSSILIMGILGGAVMPPLYGALTGALGTKWAYFILLPCYLFNAFYASRGHLIGQRED